MNKYQILQKIGQGEYGQVLKARNKDNDEVVAIKKFKDDENDEQSKRMILREVKILKMMKHQNITEFRDAFRKKGRVYLVCQFVERNLLQLIEENKRIQRDKVREYLFQILKGVSYMHSLDLIHRDIKPQNVLINSEHELKLCDFGFARICLNNSGQMTEYVATRWYRPPEILLGISNYDKSIDIWAIGCLLGEMIDGQPIFPGQTTIDQLYLVQKLLGPMIPDHQQLFLKNPKFVGVKFPELSYTDSLQRRYFAKIGKQGVDLMKKMLLMDPKERITAAQALKHPFFTKTKSRLTQSSLMKDYPIEKLKNSSVPASNNQHTLRDKSQMCMLGVNKIKGILKQQFQQMHPNPKSKKVINIQNKNVSGTSLLKNEKACNQTKKQHIQQKKRLRHKGSYDNYVQQFDEEEFPEAIPVKHVQINRNKKRAQHQNQIQGERLKPKTLPFDQIKGKKQSYYEI